MAKTEDEKNRKQKTVVYRRRKIQKRIGFAKTKIKKYMFHLENT